MQLVSSIFPKVFWSRQPAIPYTMAGNNSEVRMCRDNASRSLDMAMLGSFERRKERSWCLAGWIWEYITTLFPSWNQSLFHFALSVNMDYGPKNCEICNPSPLRDLLHDIQFITGFVLIEIPVCRQLSFIRSLLWDNRACVRALKIVRKMHKMLASSLGFEDFEDGKM